MDLLHRLFTTEALASWAVISFVVYWTVEAFKAVDRQIARARRRRAWYRSTASGIITVRLLPVLLGVGLTVLARYGIGTIPEDTWPLVAVLSGTTPILGWRLVKDRLGTGGRTRGKE
jgi:hypothetical protein